MCFWLELLLLADRSHIRTMSSCTPSVSDISVVREDRKAIQEGYLDACCGDRIEILYVGKEEELGWIYGRRHNNSVVKKGHSCNVDGEGWITRAVLHSNPEAHLEPQPEPELTGNGVSREHGTIQAASVVGTAASATQHSDLLSGIAIAETAVCIRD